MIGFALIAALLTADPAPVKWCVVSCKPVAEYGVETNHCWYDELTTCAPKQPECKDSATVTCKPRVVNLGKWDVELTIEVTSLYNRPSRNYSGY